MFKNKITGRFRLFSIMSVLMVTIISKALLVAYKWAASDVTVSDVFTRIFHWGYELTALLAIALAVTVCVYAFSYFGKKTCLGISLISFGCLAIGNIGFFVYSIISNVYSSAQVISMALSYIVEILFNGVLILLAVLFSFIFAKRRAKSGLEKRYSPIKSAFAAVSVYFFILVADLTGARVIPFLIKYSDPTTSEIKNIIADYLYYIFSLPIAMLFILLAFFIISKITGKLKLKQYYERKTVKD